MALNLGQAARSPKHRRKRPDGVTLRNTGGREEGFRVRAAAARDPSFLVAPDPCTQGGRLGGKLQELINRAVTPGAKQSKPLLQSWLSM